MVEPPWILIYCIPLLLISMGACLPACLKHNAKPQRTFITKTSNTSRFPFFQTEGRCYHPKTGMPNDCGASPSCDLGKPPHICATEGSVRSQDASTSPPVPRASSPHAWGHHWRSLAPTCRGGLHGSHQRSILQLQFWLGMVFLPFLSPHLSCSAGTDVHALPRAVLPGQSQGCSQSPCQSLVPTPPVLSTLPAERLVAQNPSFFFHRITES